MNGILSVMILLTGGVLSVRTGFVQRHLIASFKAVFSAEQGEGISPFGALCTTLAATLGTGNIVGVATAVAIGGPGALFWMIASALVGMAIKFGECMLAVSTRHTTEHGYFGGPYLYIEQKLGRLVAGLFALCGAAVGALGIGTVIQMDSIIGVLDPQRQSGHTGWKSYAFCLIFALLAGVVLWGGGQQISRFCERVVPIMAVGYIVCCGIILCRFYEHIPHALVLIVKGAFCPGAVLGGATGSFIKTFSIGVGRGIFSNEAGLGSAPIASAASRGTPIGQGLAAMSGVFLDTVVMCLLTGLCVIVTGAFQSDVSGAGITEVAFRRGLGQSGGVWLSVFLCFFAFTTIVGWYFFAGHCYEYLSGGRGERGYRLFYVSMLLLTPLIQSDRLWMLSDILSAGMALPNLITLLLYQKEIAAQTRLWKLHKSRHAICELSTKIQR